MIDGVFLLWKENRSLPWFWSSKTIFFRFLKTSVKTDFNLLEILFIALFFKILCTVSNDLLILLERLPMGTSEIFLKFFSASTFSSRILMQHCLFASCFKFSLLNFFPMVLYNFVHFLTKSIFLLRFSTRYWF